MFSGSSSLGQYADYFVVNVSSPNTVGLRDLQRREILINLLTRCKAARDSELERRRRVDKNDTSLPLLVKVLNYEFKHLYPCRTQPFAFGEANGICMQTSDLLLYPPLV